MNKLIICLTFVAIFLICGCNTSDKTDEDTGNSTFTPKSTNMSPIPSPTTTLNSNIEYILHIGEKYEEYSTCKSEITWSGDYNGEQIAPVDIGPMGEPFTVKVTMKDHDCKSSEGLQYVGHDWQLDGQSIGNPSNNPDNAVTIKVDDENPNRTLLFFHFFLVNHPGGPRSSGTENTISKQ